jgi:ADP-heptose:LPS heptosyltransferase
VRLALPEIARAKADQLRRDAKIDKPFVIFHSGSARREKFWEPGRWAKVIEQTGLNHDVDLVLTSGASPFERAHVAAVKSQTRQRVIDLSGKTDLLTLAALIGQARLLVTVDSAPMHLAAATQTPQVVLFGPTNPFHWRPREGSALILQGKSSVPLTEFSPRAAASSHEPNLDGCGDWCYGFAAGASCGGATFMSKGKTGKKKPSFWQTLRAASGPYRRLYGYVKPYKVRFILGLSLGFAFGMVNSLLPLVVARVTGTIFHGAAPNPMALRSNLGDVECRSENQFDYSYLPRHSSDHDRAQPMFVRKLLLHELGKQQGRHRYS